MEDGAKDSSDESAPEEVPGITVKTEGIKTEKSDPSLETQKVDGGLGALMCAYGVALSDSDAEETADSKADICRSMLSSIYCYFLISLVVFLCNVLCLSI